MSSRIGWFVPLLGMLVLILAAPAFSAGDQTAGAQPALGESKEWTDPVALKKKLAFAQAQSGNLDQAARTYQELVDAKEADQETLVRYTWLLNNQKKHKQAWRVISRLKWPNPDLNILELQARTAYWAEEMGPASKLIDALLKKRKEVK